MEIDWQFHYEEAKKAFQARDYKAALGHLESVVAEKKDYADVYNMLGLIYYHSSRFEDGIRAFEKALEINPSYTEASLNLAVVYNELGRFENSQQAYAVARDTREGASTYLDPYVKGKLANMHAGLGTIYKDLGFYSQAADEYKKALSLRPEFVDIKTSLGVAYRDMRDFPSAVRELEDAINLKPEYNPPRVQLGLTYYVMGNNDRAKSEWLKVLKQDPEDRMARMYMNLIMSPSS